MMDRALIQLSIVLDHPSQKLWRERGIFRIKEAFYRDFSSKETHLENSPEYHKMVRVLFSSTEEFLKKNNLSLGAVLRRRIQSSNKYLQYITKPDLIFPMIGDTEYKVNKINKRFDPFIDVEAGIMVMQAEDKNKAENSTWLSFVCGYGSKTHKHKDDLSFNLFYKGKDIFIDSGKYNYNESDKYRQYIRSSAAHNTILVHNSSFFI